MDIIFCSMMPHHLISNSLIQNVWGTALWKYIINEHTHIQIYTKDKRVYKINKWNRNEYIEIRMNKQKINMQKIENRNRSIHKKMNQQK